MARNKPQRSEAEIGAAVTAWLEDMGWDVYPEVQIGTGAHRADIMAVRGSLLWVVECKVSFGMPVLDQAARWYGEAHYISVATRRGVWMPTGVARIAIEAYGLGIIGTSERFIRDTARTGQTVLVADETRPPRLNRAAHRRSKYLRRFLHPDQKQYAAGSQSGYSSPWRRTMDAAKLLIRRNPGLTVKDLLDNVEHHYASAKTAKQCIPRWLESEPDVRVEIDGRLRRFYMAEPSKP